MSVNMIYHTWILWVYIGMNYYHTASGCFFLKFLQRRTNDDESECWWGLLKHHHVSTWIWVIKDQMVEYFLGVIKMSLNATHIKGVIKLDANVAGNFSSDVPSIVPCLGLCHMPWSLVLGNNCNRILSQENCTCCHVGMWLPVCFMAPVL